MKKVLVSIIIPTRNSEKVLGLTLRSIGNQNCPRDFYEVIIADNLSTDGTIKLAERYGARTIKIKGKPPMVCQQRNLGAKIAKGDYLFFLDSDVELSPNLIRNFLRKLSKDQNVDAWYVPYRIVARNKFLTKVRNFEEDFYKDSVVAAARIIKQEVFWKTESQNDPALSSGPGDWDLNNQLRVIGAKFGYLRDYVYHHEENLTLWKYLTKKTAYLSGSEIYKEKWQKKDPEIYNEIVKKQYDPLYRLFSIFVEKGKSRKLIFKLHLYMLFLAIKIPMSVIYFYHLAVERKKI